MNEVQKWHLAYQNIEVPDAALEAMAPFPSLYAIDFATFLEARGGDAEIISFVRAITREMAWAYDGWAKAQRDGDPAKLLASMISQANGAGYEFTRKFLTDYARNNGLPTPDDRADPPWMTKLGEVVSAPAPEMEPAQ